MEIPWERVPAEESEIAPALARAVEHMTRTGRSYAFIAPKGSVGGGPDAKASLPAPPAHLDSIAAWEDDARLDPDRALAAIQRAIGGRDAVIATTGFTGRALYAQADLDNQLYMVGSMGCASSLGLGIASSLPARRVVVLDGDGAALMRLGALATLGHERPGNLVHVLLDNGVHDSTGAQDTVSYATDVAEVARACGYPRILRASSEATLGQALAADHGELCFVHVRTQPRADRKLPRPTQTPREIADRFRAWLAR